MNWVRNLCSAFACAAFLSGSLHGAMISLDTAGADPDLTSPVFSFMADSTGTYIATFRNVSNPPTNFIKLTLFATFSATFYASNDGPVKKGSSCDGGTAFRSCSITFNPDNQPANTLEFDFMGVDATHPGLPYLGSIDLAARSFEPNQMISAAAVTVSATTVPEPSVLSFVSGGLGLLGLGVFRNQRLKRGSGAHRT